MFIRLSLLLLTTFLFLGCGGGSSSSSSEVADNIELRSVELTGSSPYPNAPYSIDVTLNSAKAYSADNNDSIIYFFLALENSSGDQRWFDSYALEEIAKGEQSYMFEFTLPDDLSVGEYMLIIKASTEEKLLDEYRFDTSLSVLAHDNLAQLEILSFRLDSEFAGDTEFDTVSSHELSISDLSSVVPTTSQLITIATTDEPIEISASATLRSNIKDASNVSIEACLEFGATCYALPISQVLQGDHNTTLLEEDDNSSKAEFVQSYLSSGLQFSLLEANEVQSVNVDLVVNPVDVMILANAIKDELLSNPTSALHAKIKLSIDADNASGMNPLLPSEVEYPLTLALTPELLASLNGGGIVTPPLPAPKFLASSGSSGECGLKKLNYEKTFERYKYGERFGAGAYLLGRAYLDATGLHTKVYSSVRVRRFSDTKHRIFRGVITADVEPGSFSDTAYSIELSSLGRTFYTKRESMADLTLLNDPVVELTAEDELKLGQKTTATGSSDGNTSDNNTSTLVDATVTSRTTLLKQKLYKKAKEELKTYKTSYGATATLLGFDANYRIGKFTELKRTIMFSIIPITVTSGAEARMGLDANIGLDGITTLNAMIEPNVYIGAYLRAGLGAAISCCWVDIEYSTGVGGDLWLLSERFTTNVTASLNFLENEDYIVQLDGDLHENITNYLSTMDGKIYAYATYYGPYDFKEPTETDWRNRTKRKTFANWEGGRYTKELLDAEQTLFSIPLADECN